MPIWSHNPHINTFEDNDSKKECIKCIYHFIQDPNKFYPKYSIAQINIKQHKVTVSHSSIHFKKNVIRKFSLF